MALQLESGNSNMNQSMSAITHTSDSNTEPPSRSLSIVAPSYRDVPTTSPSPIPHQCSTPCRGILRRRPLLAPRQRSQSPSKSVSFAESVDEHPADDWDRKAVKVACPTYREIIELKQMMLELLPDRRGLCGPEYSLAYDDSDAGCSQYFNFDDGDDVDPSCRAPPRKRLLKTVPLELCPILPTSTATKTPLNSRSASPISPRHTPSATPSPAASNHSSPIGSPKISPSKGPSTIELSAIKSPSSKSSSPIPSPAVSTSLPPLRQPVPRQKPMMTLLPLLPPRSPTTVEQGSLPERNSVPTPPLTPIVASETLKENSNPVPEQPASNKHGIVQSSFQHVPLRIQPLPASPAPRATTSQNDLGSCYSIEPSQRQAHLPLMGSYRGSFTPSPPPLPLLHSLSSCSPVDGGMPCSVNFKARANLGTAA